MSNSMEIKGRAGQDAELRFTPAGSAVATFSVADTPRKFNKDTNQWEDSGHTLWQRIQVWGPEGEKAAEEVRKGALVTVKGRLKAEEWTDKTTSELRKSTTLNADLVYVHPQKDQQQQPAQQSQSDPWGSSPQQQGFGGGTDEPPF